MRARFLGRVVLFLFFGVPSLCARPPEVRAQGLESGSYGEIAVGASRSATIATGNGSVVYHTYTTSVGPNTGQITIRVDGGGLDVDMAVKAGSEIESYDPVDEGGDYDFLDTSPGTEASYTYTNPDPGIIYIDVMNLLDQPIAYTVDVQSTTGVVETSRVDPAASGTVGQIELGQTVSRQLSGMEGSAAFHTYYVDVPAGAGELVIEVRGDQDFDVAVKHGSTISSYAGLDEGGNWDYQDVEASNDATIVVPGPAKGRWYIDVYEAWTSDAVGSYVLTVR